MIYNEIYKFDFISDLKSYDLKKMNLKTDDDKMYMLKTFSSGKLSKISDININDTNYGIDKSVKIVLNKGKYYIKYVKGAILNYDNDMINDCINYSNGRINLKQIKSSNDDFENDIKKIFDDYYNNINFFEIDVKSKTTFNFWIDSNNAKGSITFSLYEFHKEKKKLFNDIFFTNDNKNNAKIFLNENEKYDIRLYEVINDTVHDKPIFKYPVGTYQLSFNESISKLYDVENYRSIIGNDKNKFDFGNDKKLKSLRNIDIPFDIDPTHYYMLIGKIDMMLFIDFNNDNFFIKPNGYAECFLNLSVPERKIEIMESTNDHSIYHIVDYDIVSYSFSNNDDNINSIKKWIKCNDNDIHIDEYELYYYIEHYNMFDWYYEKILDIINENALCIGLYDIEAVCEDNLDNKIKSNNIILDYKVTKCKWRILDKSFKATNNIKWESLTDWINDNEETPNHIIKKFTGDGSFLISNRKFMNITGIDKLDKDSNGDLTNEQFKMIDNIIGPNQTPFERFQYWTQFKLN